MEPARYRVRQEPARQAIQLQPVHQRLRCAGCGRSAARARCAPELGILRSAASAIARTVMYDPVSTLQTIDQNLVLVVSLCLVSLFFNYAYFIESIRIGYVHKTYSVPGLVTLVFLPHDVSYLLHFDKWFNEYDHWFCKLWWVALIFTSAIEGIFFYQLIRYGRKEIMPKASQRTYTIAMLLALLVEIGRAVQQECRDRSRMPSSA
eukprot:TRINITY_DN4138_c0_g1_i3.p1 TRINITY_DN4138_c0_g1~~TRINITY_DN4138_c0_g1_i3.p1  ORF type:complete len:206 (+),score=31.30 TRINITY_DN4138_c0_g1_i3:151-768(+)